MNARAIRGLLLTAALATAGCATAPEGPADAERTGEPAPTTVEEDGTVRHSVPNRAVALLWDRAERARKAGRIEDALGSLERALRLTPDDPILWSRVAELRLRQGEYAVAENLAAKSNALAGNQRLLRYRNWLLIAEARQRRGDTEGAAQARAEAEQYGGP